MVGQHSTAQDRTVSQPSKRLDASLNLSDFLCALQAQEKREINRDGKIEGERWRYKVGVEEDGYDSVCVSVFLSENLLAAN